MAKKLKVILHDCLQRSPEWFALRKQYPLTASHAQAIGNNGKGLETLVWEKLAEVHSSADKEQYTNEDIQRGIELEEQARSLYELETGSEVALIGFVTNESISEVAGASPDGLIGSDGLLEIKCQNDVKHFKMIAKGVSVEPQYEWQIQMQMLITERKWCDVLLFNPNFQKSLIITRIKADKEKQKAILEGLKKGEKFINEIEKKL